MYHIKNDQRSQRSARMVVAGLSECLQRHSLSDITITELTTTAKIGRATFYRLFDSVVDVLAYECQQLFDEMGMRSGSSNISLHDWLLNNLQIFMDHQALLSALVKNGQVQLLYQAQSAQTTRITGLVDTSKLTATEQEYFQESLIALLIGGLTVWVKNGQKEGPEELLDNLSKTIELLWQSLQGAQK